MTVACRTTGSQLVSQNYTTGSLAAHFGVEVWQVRRLFERGLLPEPGRVGAYRVVTEAELPAVEKALIAAGYLSGTRASAC
jgi:hypothetical protein